jgi:hypothetical protein
MTGGEGGGAGTSLFSDGEDSLYQLTLVRAVCICMERGHGGQHCTSILAIHARKTHANDWTHPLLMLNSVFTMM